MGYEAPIVHVVYVHYKNQLIVSRDFIASIANFKKLLIAGVHGDTVGIGVTILPLFDIIYATNKASFSTPYVKIGQVPENGTIFVKSNKISHRLVSLAFEFINGKICVFYRKNI